MKNLNYSSRPLFFLITLLLLHLQGFSQCNKPQNLTTKMHNVTWYDITLNWAPPVQQIEEFISTDTLEVFNNGNFITNKGIGYKGADISASAADELSYGWNIDAAHTHRIIDDFTLPVRTKITSIVFYVGTYGGRTSSENSFIRGANVALYDKNPAIYASTEPLKGSLSAKNNMMAGKPVFANAYITTALKPELSINPIWEITISFDTILSAGTYWLGFSTLMDSASGSMAFAIATRNIGGGSTGNAYHCLTPSDCGPAQPASSGTSATYGIPFILKGQYLENTVKGYEVLRNGESIYKKNSLLCSFSETLPSSPDDYVYAVKALWLKDNCESDTTSILVNFPEDHCLSTFSYNDIKQNFNDSNLLSPIHCWNFSIVGQTNLYQYFDFEGTSTSLSPPCHPYEGGAMLVYGSNVTIGASPTDTGYLQSPKFTTNGKKLIVSFWMYRDNAWINNSDHLNVYCIPDGESIDGKTPNLTVHRSTVQSPVTAYAKTGWYRHSFLIDDTLLNDPQRLLFAFVGRGGGNMYIDDINIAEAEEENGNCDVPMNPHVVFSPESARITWDAPGAFENNIGELTYHTGNIVPTHAIGSSGNYNMTIASRWDITDLKNLGIIQGTTIKAISFVPAFTGTTVDNFTVLIWQEGSMITQGTTRTYRVGKLIYQQPVDKTQLISREWSTIDLEIPIEIDPSKELWFGVKCDVKNASAGPFISDEGPYAFSKGNLVYSDDIGQWTTAWHLDNNYPFNWCLKAIVNTPNNALNIPSDPSTSVKEYAVYRDENEIATVTDKEYIDNGSYTPDNKYKIVARYNNGCYSPAAEAQVFTVENQASFENHMFTIYPNPVSNILNIEGKSIKRIEIYNYIGQLVGVQTMNCHQIDFSGYKSGIYLLKIIDINDHAECKQIVVMH